MTTVLWLIRRIIHYNFLNSGETITAEKYCYEIDKIHQELQRLRLILISQKGLHLHHKNAPPHVSKMTMQKLNKLSYETLPYSVYSPDLSSTDYHFFKHLDNFLQDKVFNNQATLHNAFG
uniref:Histone-lysine N-methyltransferase SETMAR n=1 Tax=Heterorhabditis bacteriophora TaxID=37862 RepID=A0A1I7WDY9_HETBA